MMPKSRFLAQALVHGLLDPVHAGFGQNAVWRPLVDVIASPELARVRLELAGISTEELEISIAGNVLRVAGRRPLPETGESRATFGYRRAEIQYGTFERTVELPWLADAARVKVCWSNGLLLIELVPLRVDNAASPMGAEDEGMNR